VSRRPAKKQNGIPFSQFQRQVKQGRVDPLYLFTGDEDLLHRQALDLLYDCVDAGTREFNIAVFVMGGDSLGSGSGSGKSSAATAIDMAEMLPMISKRRVVVIRDFEKIKEGELDLVLEYLKRPASTATVVFQAASLDQRRKITFALLKTCTVVSLDHPSEGEAIRWAEDHFKQKRCRIERPALNRLVELIGPSMSRLANEMDKLITCGGGGPITADMVDSLVPRVRAHTNWELWDALIAREGKKAMKLALRLLDDGAEPVVMLGTLASLYRRMLIAQEMISRGADSQEIIKATGQYGEKAGRFSARVRSTPRSEILQAISRIARADDDLKNSVASARLQIEYLVAELTLPAPLTSGHTEILG
jgi:DNA polymerase III delta subunit